MAISSSTVRARSGYDTKKKKPIVYNTYIDGNSKSSNQTGSSDKDDKGGKSHDKGSKNNIADVVSSSTGFHARNPLTRVNSLSLSTENDQSLTAAKRELRRARRELQQQARQRDKQLLAEAKKASSYVEEPSPELTKFMEADDDVITELDKTTTTDWETDEDTLFPRDAQELRIQQKTQAFIHNKVRLKTKHCKQCSRPNRYVVSKEIHKLADQYNLDHLHAIELTEEIQSIPGGGGDELLKLKRQIERIKGEPPNKKTRNNRVGKNESTAKERSAADAPSLDDPNNRMSVSD